MTNQLDRLCPDCTTPLTNAAYGFDGCMHVESDVTQTQGYVIGADRFFADWDNGMDTDYMLLVDRLPEPRTVYLSKSECCGWWHEPDWDEYCERCGDFK